MKKADILAGSLLAIMGLVVIELSRRIPPPLFTKTLLPGFFPMWLGIGLTICAFLLVIEAILFGKKTERVEWPSKIVTKRVAGFMVLAALYILSQNILGYFASTTILLIVFSRLFGAKRWRELIVLAVVTSAIALFSFKFWLGIPFPSDLLGLEGG
ncbi:MAG: tripartite tricarboxylate transporter TctB family protein [Deltaproteobacteria bacterium]|nr:tripartite tricarboxylate transporter TctB family protein [Deltaproteobacteria bacterium]